MGAVQTKSPAEVGSYKTWLASVAEKVSKASKEGGFLGVGGTLVSREEQEALTQLADVLGTSVRENLLTPPAAAPRQEVHVPPSTPRIARLTRLHRSDRSVVRIVQTVRFVRASSVPNETFRTSRAPERSERPNVPKRPEQSDRSDMRFQRLVHPSAVLE
jgi:hypothetical protein